VSKVWSCGDCAWHDYWEPDPCFTPTTQVLLADGTSKDIQDIEPGDKVLSYDMFTDQQVIGEVVELQEHLDGSYEYYIINNTLEITPNHPVLINGVWSRISNLEIGDTLEDNNGNLVTVESIEKGYQTDKIYNVIVKNYNTFYADSYLVASSF
jgi:hypothetical protein